MSSADDRCVGLPYYPVQSERSTQERPRWLLLSTLPSVSCRFRTPYVRADSHSGSCCACTKSAFVVADRALVARCGADATPLTPDFPDGLFAMA